MNSVTDKVNNAAAVAKEKAEIFKANAQEKAEKAAATTKEGKIIAEERGKAKEYEAKMKLHETKAQITEEKLLRHHGHGYGHLHQGPVGTAAVNPTTGVPPTSTYPPQGGLGGVNPTTGVPPTSTYPTQGGLRGRHNTFL